jgi:hypothetical protein
MIIVHIHEITSTQVSEIIVQNVETALCAYARNAAFRWEDLIAVHGVRRADGMITRMVFEFKEERLILRHICNSQYAAAWLDS